MIRIARKAEPSDFDAKVRRPGLSYLKGLSPGEKPNWSGHGYWRKAKEDMINAYGGICAYACCEITPSSSAEIDHFHPKSRYQSEAYEWQNLRLCSSNINKKKCDHDVLDPFDVRDLTFGIVLATGRLVKLTKYDPAYEALCDKTVKVLGLNEHEYTRMRKDILDDYLRGEITISNLQKRNPFVYSEVQRLHVGQVATAAPLTVESLREEI